MGWSVIVAAGLFALRIAVDGPALDALRRREPAALRSLVMRHHGSLVRLAQAIVKNREAAEDVAQETWIAVIDGLDGFDGRSALATWIIAILLNKARSHARREKRFVPLESEFGADLDQPAVDPSRFQANGHWADPPIAFDGADPERVVAGREIWRHVAQVIDTLPPAQKSVLVLRDVEGRDAAETASLLSISRENQRILLHRARAKVRAAVEALMRGEGAVPVAKA
jgi:RNA polymerase sigma-70 factor (ECF subfamily)